MAASPRQYTVAELERAHRFRTLDFPVPWDVIGRHLDRNPENLRQAYARWRSGSWQPGRRAAARAARVAAYEQAIAAGCVTLAALAARFGVTRPAVHATLLAAGIDLEERRALAPAAAVEAARMAGRFRLGNPGGAWPKRLENLAKKPRAPRDPSRGKVYIRNGVGNGRTRDPRGLFTGSVKPVASSAYI